MSGYLHKQVDLDAIFEPVTASDIKYDELTGHRNAVGTDLRDLYVPLTNGSKVAYDVGYAIKGLDVRNVFAAKGSVSRYTRPLPWDTTVNGSSVPPVFRQLGRNLKTNTIISGGVRGDGVVDLVLRRPMADSVPNVYHTDILHSSNNAKAWDLTTLPAGANYQVKVEVVLGNGVTMTGGGLNTWVNLPTATSRVDFSKTLTYLHDSQNIGTQASSASVRIHARRSDYPDTNYTSADLKINLSFLITDVLFESNAWGNPSTVINSNVKHVPGSAVQEFGRVGFIVSDDGNVYYQAINNGVWSTTHSLRWRKQGIDPIYDNDFEFRVVPVSGDIGYLTNAVTDWNTVSRNFRTWLTAPVLRGDYPGTYTRTCAVRVEIRQKSTKTFVQDNVLLPANQIAATFTMSAGVTISGPAKLAWPDMSSWAKVWDFAKSTAWLPESSGTESSAAELLFLADGTVQVLKDGSVVATGPWLPAGVSASNIEMSATMSGSGTGVATELSTVSGWVNPVGRKFSVSASRKHSAGVGNVYRLYGGNITFRRKDWVADTKSATASLKTTVNLTAAVSLVWNMSSWQGSWSATESVPWLPEQGTLVDSEEVTTTFYPDGRCIVTKNGGVVIKSGTWLPAGISASQVEAIATLADSASGAQNSGSGSINQMVNWTNMGSIRQHVTKVSRAHSNGAGTSQRTLTGTIAFRRIANYADGVTANLTLTAAQTMTGVADLAWNMSSWQGTHDLKKVYPLNPATPTAKNYASMGISILTNGQILIYKDGVTYKTGNWLPAGVSADAIEVKFVTNQVISGSALVSNESGTTNPISGWTTLSANKTVSIVTARTHAGVGFASLGTAGRFYFRRKSKPTDEVSLDFAMYARVTHDTPTALGLSLSGAWLATAHTVSVARNASGAGTTVGRLTAVIRGNGTVSIYNQKDGETAVLVGTYTWRSGSLPASNVEILLVTGAPSGGVPTIRNDLTGWSSITSGQTDLTVVLANSGNHASATADTTSVWAGTMYMRRKDYPSEQVSAAFRMAVQVKITAANNVLVPVSSLNGWARTYTNNNSLTAGTGPVTTVLNRFDMAVVTRGTSVPGFSAIWHGERFSSNLPTIKWSRGTYNATWGVMEVGVVKTNQGSPLVGSGMIAFSGTTQTDFNQAPDIFTCLFTNSAGEQFNGNFTKHKFVNGNQTNYLLNGVELAVSAEVLEFYNYLGNTKTQGRNPVRVQMTPILL